MGFCPVKYLDKKKGSATCKGTRGTASNAIFSFGIPASTSFSPVTTSQAENPIFAVNKTAASNLQKREKIFHSLQSTMIFVNC